MESNVDARQESAVGVLRTKMIQMPCVEGYRLCSTPPSLPSRTMQQDFMATYSKLQFITTVHLQRCIWTQLPADRGRVADTWFSPCFAKCVPWISSRLSHFEQRAAAARSPDPAENQVLRFEISVSTSNWPCLPFVHGSWRKRIMQDLSFARDDGSRECLYPHRCLGSH